MGLGQKHQKAKREIVELKTKVSEAYAQLSKKELDFKIMSQLFMEHSKLNEDEVLSIFEESKSKILSRKKLSSSMIASQVISMALNGRM